jgi:seryl-tRNA synthetase
MKTKGSLGAIQLAAASLLFTGTLLISNAVSADREEIENTRTKIEKWIETKQLISQEKRDLVLAKEMLNERIELVQQEINSLHGKVSDANKNFEEADKKRAGMLEENTKLKEASVSLADVLVSLEERTKELLKRLPDPICQRVKPLSQRLPEKTGETQLTTSERFQNVVGILNEVDKFNREITISSEVRTLPDGTSVEVAAVYAGIGQAFYASADGSVAGIGSATDEGWVWKPNNEASSQIAEAIAILKNEKVATFVRLPVEIH